MSTKVMNYKYQPEVLEEDYPNKWDDLLDAQNYCPFILFNASYIPKGYSVEHSLRPETKRQGAALYSKYTDLIGNV